MNRNAAYRQGPLTNSGDAGFPVALRPIAAAPLPANLGDSETLSGSAPIPDSFSAHRLNSEIWRLVLTDKLTGICNQDGFLALADQEWRTSRRASREMVFAKIELDNLQEIREGSARGEADLAEIALAKVLMKTFRRSDVLSRWDKGEFTVLAVGAEGLSEPLLRARIQAQVEKSGAQVSRFPLVLKGRIVRVSPRGAGSIRGVLACVERDFADFKRTWVGAGSGRPIIIVQDATKE